MFGTGGENWEIYWPLQVILSNGEVEEPPLIASAQYKVQKKHFYYSVFAFPKKCSGIFPIHLQ